MSRIELRLVVDEKISFIMERKDDLEEECKYHWQNAALAGSRKGHTRKI